MLDTYHRSNYNQFRVHLTADLYKSPAEPSTNAPNGPTPHLIAGNAALRPNQESRLSFGRPCPRPQQP